MSAAIISPSQQIQQMQIDQLQKFYREFIALFAGMKTGASEENGRLYRAADELLVTHKNLWHIWSTRDSFDAMLEVILENPNDSYRFYKGAKIATLMINHQLATRCSYLFHIICLLQLGNYGDAKMYIETPYQYRGNYDLFGKPELEKIHKLKINFPAFLGVQLNHVKRLIEDGNFNAARDFLAKRQYLTTHEDLQPFLKDKTEESNPDKEKQLSSERHLLKDLLCIEYSRDIIMILKEREDLRKEAHQLFKGQKMPPELREYLLSLSPEPIELDQIGLDFNGLNPQNKA